MSEIIKLQNPLGFITDGEKICSFNSEVIENMTKPLIHQSARFWLINKGDATAIIKGRTVHLVAGALVSVLPWEITEITDVKIPLQYYVVIYHFDALNLLIKSFYNQSNDSIKLIKDMEENPVAYCSKKQYSRIMDIFLDLKNELGLDTALKTAEPKTLSSIYITNHLVSIMLEFLRICHNEACEDNGEPFKKEEILQYIYCHLSENITAKHLSKIFYMSESRISQYIKQLTGLSVVSLCHEMRIVKVSDFLLFTDFNLDELAGILGYADASHISKVFSAKMGMKISEYRKTYCNIGKICNVKEGKEAYAVVNFIYRNHSENITLQSVSENFSVSALEINKILLYQVEKNFNDFLNFVRINHSAVLLATTDKTVMDIAIEVGYNNTKTFSRNFLKYKVMIPTDFRKKTNLQPSDIGKSTFTFE